MVDRNAHVLFTTRGVNREIYTPWTPLVLIVLIAALAVPPVHAQFDPGEHNILQAGILVGHIYVPMREPGACEYLEHWFVFDTYRYPGSEPGLETTFEVAEESLEEILRRTREVDGHWITVKSLEQRPECSP